MELIVAEKPKVAEKIAYAIGDKVEKKSYKNVSYYELVHDGKELVVAPAVGHVYTLVEKQKTTAYPVFDIHWVPAYEASPRKAAYTKDYVEVLQKLAKRANTFVGACDYDIEGTTIAYNVFRYATTIRHGKRMKFSALTKEDLVIAYDQMGEFDYNNAYAGETRHILDWYYGINLSRALMSSLKAAMRYRVLSIGRVQGPALAILAELEKQIRAFVSVPYWEVSILVKGIEFNHESGRFEKEELADVALINTGNECFVQSVDKKEQKIQPPPCFDLTSLQVEVYRLFKYSPSQTMEIAQGLYEASLITYPRTSSQQIPSTIHVSSIISNIGKNPEYTTLVDKITKNKWYKPVQGKKDDPAHPAIHPTGMKSANSLDDREKKVYDLIVRRFLAAFAPAATRERMRVEVIAEKEKYNASGSRILEPGWTEFYGKYYTTEDIQLPEFRIGEKYKVEKKRKARKETKPPKRYTEASLVSELEGRHLGTKATRAVIVDTLFKRGYVDGKSLETSDFGLKICEVLQRYAPEILDENLTRKMEEEMEGIQEGKVQKEQVIVEGKEILVQILDKWKMNEAKIGTELLESLKTTEEKENILGPCDKCGNNLRIIRMKAGRQFIGCLGYPNCKNTYPLPGQAKVKNTDKKCKTCGKPIVNVKKTNTRYTMCIDPNCPSKLEWKKSDDNEKNNRAGSKEQNSSSESGSELSS